MDDLRRIREERLYAIMMGIFVTFVVLTNTVGVKLFTFMDLVLPVSIIWFPLTFLVTDIVSEIFGRKRANLLVGMGFGMSVVLLICVLLGLSAPTSPAYALGEQYEQVFAPTWRLLFASMCAYLLAQFADVRLFHFFKTRTGGKHLWLRNNGSTIISQFIDTVTVTMIFLYKNPAVFTGTFRELWVIIFSVYMVKISIALLDTPACYLGVWLIRRHLNPPVARDPIPS